MSRGSLVHPPTEHDIRYSEVEKFDQFCGQLRSHLRAHDKNDLKNVQLLYRRAVGYAYDLAKAGVESKNPNDFTDVMTPAWKQFRFNHGELSRLISKYRYIKQKDIRL